jgi:adenylate cyclase
MKKPPLIFFIFHFSLFTLPYCGAQPHLIDSLQRVLKTYEQTGDKKGEADTYNKIGISYSHQANLPEALKNILAALTISEKMGYRQTAGNSYNALARVYETEHNFPEALKKGLTGLKIRKEIKDTTGMAQSYNEIAEIEQFQNNYSAALINVDSGQQLYENLHDKKGIAGCYFNRGLIYQNQGNYPEALKNDLAALTIYEEMGDKNDIAYITINISEVYYLQGNLTQALSYGKKALSLISTLDQKGNIKVAYVNLANINYKLGNYKEAYENFVLYKKYYDTIYNGKNEMKLADIQLQYNFDRHQDSLKTEQSKKDIIAKKEIQNQKNIRNFLFAGALLVIIFSGFIFRSLKVSRRQKMAIENEKHRSDELLLNILPAEVAKELKEKGSAEAKSFDEVTVIFTDFKSFTRISENLSAEELVAEIDYCFKGFDHIINKYNIEKIKTIGDSYMAVGGLPVPNKTNAKDVVNAALEILEFIKKHNLQKVEEGKPILEIRIGINTGPVVAGIVGVKKFAYDIWGDTVNLASRMESSGEPGKINISGSTYELVKNDFTCTYRGKIQAKNKGEVDMYFVS